MLTFSLYMLTQLGRCATVQWTVEKEALLHCVVALCMFALRTFGQ